MNITSIEYIEQVTRILNQNGLTKITVGDAGAQIIVEKTSVTAMPYLQQKTEAAQTVVGLETAAPIASGDSLKEVKAPLVGVFYAAADPEAEEFVKIGDNVKKGDVLCIIEAMKFMNEKTAEHEGTVAEIFAANGDVVEYGQVLFKIA